MIENGWVTLKAVHPSWCTLQVPSDVANLLGISQEEVAGPNGALERTLHFFERGPLVVRVVGMRFVGGLLADDATRARLIARASSSDKLIFTLPDRVEEHLGLEVFDRGRPGVTGTHDMVDWVVPGDEYYAYREAEFARRKFQPPRLDGAHVYLIRALIPNLLPTVRTLESGSPASGKTLVGFAVPPKR